MIRGKAHKSSLWANIPEGETYESIRKEWQIWVRAQNDVHNEPVMSMSSSSGIGSSAKSQPNQNTDD